MSAAACWPEDVTTELDLLEANLRSDLAGAPGTLGEIARSALAAGGKRMRPRLVFAAAGACGGDAATAVSCRPFAIAVEYLHTATLLHDDLVDGASLRRGEPPAYQKWGPKEAVLAGDLLLARCLSLVVEDGMQGAASVLARATERMAIGEALEVELARRTDVGEDDYYLFAAAKTAALFTAAAELGAIAAGAPEVFRKKLGRFGEHLGTAFQVVDDVLDLVAPSEESGKEAGIDVRAGVPTLPALKALALLGAEERTLLERVLRGDTRAETDRARAVELVRTHGVAPAAEAARALLARARGELDGFERGPYIALLEDMTHALERKLP